MPLDNTIDGKAKTAKDVVEAIDPEKKSITFRMLEGDILNEFKSYGVTLQASPKSGGEGSIVHLTLEYEKLHDGIAHPETLLQFLSELCNDIDAYLLKEN
ncbi:hypothetical protein DITRI_Ditri15bG0019900 [Diplodiscus trichospermus]